MRWFVIPRWSCWRQPWLDLCAGTNSWYFCGLVSQETLHHKNDTLNLQGKVCVTYEHLFFQLHNIAYEANLHKYMIDWSDSLAVCPCWATPQLCNIIKTKIFILGIQIKKDRNSSHHHFLCAYKYAKGINIIMSRKTIN